MKGVQDRFSGSQRRWDVAAFLVTVLVAVYYTVGVLWRRAQRGESLPSYDIYAAHYPNIVYALRSLQQGYGLLWNNLQNCGQPFVPSTLLGLFYPLHAVFLVVDVETGLLVLTALHLAVGGVGAYCLCRELGLSGVAAMCGALTFEVSGPTVLLAGWLPTSILGIYVWIPVAMLLLERIIQVPSIGKGMWLAVVLTLELLPGYPQILFFTYQIIGLRVLWEFASARVRQPFRLLAVTALGLALPVFLGAAYLLPSIEFSRVSVRGHDLAIDEIRIPNMTLTWKGFREDVGLRRTGLGTTFAVVPVALAALALTSRYRRMAVFYFLLAALYLVLPFDNPLFSLYLRLPGGKAFRDPARFIWITNFAFSVLVGMGTEVVVRARAALGLSQLRRLAASLLAVGAFYSLSPPGLYAWEWLCLGGTLIACTGALLLPSGHWLARVALPALLAVNLFLVDRQPYLGYLKDDNLIYRNAAEFSLVKEQMTPQDRVYQFGKHPDYALMLKSPSVFAVPSIADYEPQTSERFARLYVWLLRNQDMGNNLNMFMYTLTNVPRNKRLLDLMATRYLLRDVAGEEFGPEMLHSLRFLWQHGSVRVYENPNALPRAFFVPSIRVVASPEEVLRQLASGGPNLREVALVESVPTDGFLGHSSAAAGEVTVLQDRAEELALHVNTTGEGFVFLSDQYYPGWEATVNDIPTPIMRANYAFRLIRVPAGASTVRFRYRPKSLWLGMWVSVLALVAVVSYGVAQGGRRRKRLTQPDGGLGSGALTARIVALCPVGRSNGFHKGTVL